MPGVLGGSNLNPTDVLESLVKGGEIFHFVRLQLCQTRKGEIRSHDPEFMLSSELMERALIWVSYQAFKSEEVKFSVLHLHHPMLSLALGF